MHHEEVQELLHAREFALTSRVSRLLRQSRLMSVEQCHSLPDQRCQHDQHHFSGVNSKNKEISHRTFMKLYLAQATSKRQRQRLWYCRGRQGCDTFGQPSGPPIAPRAVPGAQALCKRSCRRRRMIAIRHGV